MGNSCSTGCLLKDEERMEMKIDVGMGAGSIQSEVTQSKVKHCEQGHLLQPTTGVAGNCADCKVLFNKGDPVMHCAECKFSRCAVCYPLNALQVGDVVQAIVGTKGFINSDKVEVYTEGDEGTVRKFFQQEGTGQDRVKIAWSRTGLTTTCQANKWAARFVLVRRGCKKADKGKAATPNAAKNKDTNAKADATPEPLDSDKSIENEAAKENVPSPTNRSCFGSEALDLKLHADKLEVPVVLNNKLAASVPLDSKDQIEKALMEFEAIVSEDHSVRTVNPIAAEVSDIVHLGTDIENEAILDERAPEIEEPRTDNIIAELEKQLEEPGTDNIIAELEKQEAPLLASDQGSTHAESGSDEVSESAAAPLEKKSDAEYESEEQALHLGDFRVAPPDFWENLHAQFTTAIVAQEPAVMIDGIGAELPSSCNGAEGERVPDFLEEPMSEHTAETTDCVHTRRKPSAEELQILADYVKASTADFADFLKAPAEASEFPLFEKEVHESPDELVSSTPDFFEFTKPVAEPAEPALLEKDVHAGVCIPASVKDDALAEDAMTSKDWRFLPSVGTWLMAPRP